MTRRTELTLMWLFVGATLGNLVFVPFAQSGAQLGPNTIGFVGDEGSSDALPLFLLALTATSLGALAVLRNTATRAGLALLTFGLFVPLSATAAFVADWAFVEQEFPQWLALVLVPTGGLGWAIGGTAAAVFLLRFPTGEYRSPRWRWVARAGLLGLGLLVAQIFNERFYSSDLADHDFFYAPSIESNPIGVAVISRDGFDLAFGVGILLLLWVALAGAFLSLLVRFFTAHGDERQQLKIVGFTVIAVVVVAVIAANLHAADIAPWLFETVAPYLFSLIPVAIGVALLKYRLYDIDVVINKTLVYGALFALITIVFAAVAFLPFVITGASDTSTSGELVLPLIATVVLVVVFQPVRDRLQKWANRIVYGRRATPYEALSDFSKEIAGSVADEELLARMAQILAEGTGAERAEVWLLENDHLRLAAAHPPLETTRLIAVDELPRADASVDVTHRGERLGVLRLEKKPGDPVRPIERRLLDDLASQAGVVLRNFRLTDELMERLEQLRTSRQRLVTAQDSERRRLERDLHDGAQQQLVALKIKLGLALQLSDAERRSELLRALMAETDEAIDSLRTLARGIYPPTLAQEGLVKALRGQAAKSPVVTEIAALGVQRYSPGVEAAVYFCTLEALQNIAKYADASEARVVLTGTNGRLDFEVSDNGEGFDPATTPRGAGLQNMEDRLEALGGTITIVSSPGGGTTVRGSIPIVSPGD